MPKPAALLGLGPNPLWKLQFGTPGRKGLQEVAPAKLGSFELDPWFTVTDDGEWVQVRVSVAAGTSSGSTYPRVELRQMTAAGKEAAWDSRKVDCWFELELMVTHLPANKGQLCVLQLHDDEDDLLEVIYQRNSVGGYEFTQRVDGSSTGQPRIPHALYKSCVLALGIKGGVPTVYLDGKAVLTTTKMPQSSVTYAKLLNYLQSNTSKDRADEYGEILSRNVRSGLGAYPGPATAPPSDPPQTTGTVTIIRHAEKPTDPDSHDLSEAGRARAQALVAYFTTSGRTPTWIFASKGDSASNRMVQTAQPLADQLGLPIDTRFDSERYVDETARLLADRAQAGDTVLAVLEHSCIPDVASDLAEMMGAPQPRGDWPDDDYASVWVLEPDGWRYTEQGAPPSNDDASRWRLVLEQVIKQLQSLLGK